LQNWAWRAKRGEREIQSRHSCKRIDRIGAILIAMTRIMKGFVSAFELSALPTS
jgi:hypothetical protein